MGVDVFFVISGFLITSILAREIENGSYSIAAFYERRVRRIFPALAVTLIASCVAAWFVLLPSELVRFAKTLAAATFFVANVVFRSQTDYFEGAAELQPLLHTWSLCVEEQFYLLFPLVLASLLRRQPRWTLPVVWLVTLASLAASSWAAFHDVCSARRLQMPASCA